MNTNLSNPRVMSMKKKMIAQKKEKGIEAIASLNRKLRKSVFFPPVNNEYETLPFHANILNFKTLKIFQ